MTRPAITVENLSKLYRLGVKEEVPDTLASAFTGVLRSPLRNWRRLRNLSRFKADEDSPDVLWALKDVSFEVPEGEVLGVIGNNGAGKSTLLKILSRITEPTSGRAVIRGRVSSLLEVGTGFHPELTGRDNIYMNGTILGMTKREIDRKFDEIVNFSGVEKFLDTPIKRYSSGMQVRLAFAVAAHLEPEILIIDEVLAVGDADFQRKCMGKMRDVARGGRTVLFVSHNLDAVQQLCTLVCVMKNGFSTDLQSPRAGITAYLEGAGTPSSPGGSDFRLQREHNGPRILQAARLKCVNGLDRQIETGDSAIFEIDINSHSCRNSTCGLIITDDLGHRIAAFHTLYHSGLRLQPSGPVRLTCKIPSLPLVPGHYFADVIFADEHRVIERAERALCFDVVFADLLSTGRLPASGQGHIVLNGQWVASSETSTLVL